MSLGGVPPSSIQGVCTGRHKAKQGDPQTPQNWGCGMGGPAPGGRSSARGFALERDPKRTQKTPKMVKNQPQMEALGPRVCGGGGGTFPHPPSCFLLHPRFVFGVNFWSLAAPSSWPINIYIYIYICIQKWGVGPGRGDTPNPTAPPPKKPNRRDSKCSETVFGCHQTCGSRAGARPGRGPRRWGSRPPPPPSSPPLPPSPLPPPHAGGVLSPPRLDEGDPYGDAG